MMLRSLAINFMVLCGALGGCVPQGGDSDSDSAGATEATDGEVTTGDATAGGEGPCACIDPEQYARQSFVCADSPCGVVFVECDQEVDEMAAACFGQGRVVSLDEVALDCAIDRMIAGEDGMIEWHVLDQGFGASGFEGGFLHVVGDKALTRTYGALDLGSNENAAGFVTVKPAAYFSGCKAMPDPQERFRCLIAWSDEEPKADCDPEDSRSEEF